MWLYLLQAVRRQNFISRDWITIPRNQTKSYKSPGTNVPAQAMKAHGGLEVQIHTFSSSGSKLQLVVSFTPGRYIPIKKQHQLSID
jgi:hypothetical protein